MRLQLLCSFTDHLLQSQRHAGRKTHPLEGNGEVVRVEGKDILSWKIAPTPAGRELEVQLNQLRLSHTHL